MAASVAPVGAAGGDFLSGISNAATNFANSFGQAYTQVYLNKNIQQPQQVFIPSPQFVPYQNAATTDGAVSDFLNGNSSLLLLGGIALVAIVLVMAK